VKIRVYCCCLMDDDALDLDVASFYSFCLTKSGLLFHSRCWVHQRCSSCFWLFQMKLPVWSLFLSFCSWTLFLGLGHARKPKPRVGWTHAGPKIVFGLSFFLQREKYIFFCFLGCVWQTHCQTCPNKFLTVFFTKFFLFCQKNL
jgi:hypothetical protein